MPSIRNEIEELRDAFYALPWYKRFFFPRAVSKSLNQRDLIIKNELVMSSGKLFNIRLSVFDLYKGYENAWFKNWFDCLKVFGKSDLCSKATSLYPHIKGEDEQLVFDAVIDEYYDYDLVTGFNWSDRTRLLEANRVKINFNEELSRVLIALKDANPEFSLTKHKVETVKNHFKFFRDIFQSNPSQFELNKAFRLIDVQPKIEEDCLINVFNCIGDEGAYQDYITKRSRIFAGAFRPRYEPVLRIFSRARKILDSKTGLVYFLDIPDELLPPTSRTDLYLFENRMLYTNFAVLLGLIENEDKNLNCFDPDFICKEILLQKEAINRPLIDTLNTILPTAICRLIADYHYDNDGFVKSLWKDKFLNYYPDCYSDSLSRPSRHEKMFRCLYNEASPLVTKFLSEKKTQTGSSNQADFHKVKDAKSDKRHGFFDPAKNLPESDSPKEEKGVPSPTLSLRDY